MNAYNANAERLFILDPQNEDHLRLLNEFQTENNIDLSNCLKQYEDSNTVKKKIFIEQSSKMRDFCQTHIETKRKRKLIKQATDYALNILGMEEVFVNISTTDEKLMTSMELEGYEPITDETGNLFFLKDKGFI